MPKRRMPVGALPLVVQGERIGYAVRTISGLRVTIENVLSEFEKRDGLEDTRTFDIKEQDE